MPYSVLMLIYRKPGTTPEQFKEHYENKHVPYMKEIGGKNFPLSHTRRYLQRTKTVDASTTVQFPAAVMAGSQEDFGYDAVSEMVFENAAALQTFHEILSRPDIVPGVAADCDAFMDAAKTKMVVLGETVETRRDS